MEYKGLFGDKVIIEPDKVIVKYSGIIREVPYSELYSIQMTNASIWKNGTFLIQTAKGDITMRFMPKHKNTFQEIYSILIKKCKSLEGLDEFKVTNQVGSYLKIDDEHKKVMFISDRANRIVNYSDIMSFEIIEDGETITKGGTGRALAGGILFGTTGAIVGGVTAPRTSNTICNNLSLIVRINDLDNPTIVVDLISYPIEKNRDVYRILMESLQKAVSVLSIITKSEEAQKTEKAPNASTVSAADEIRKYKALLDDGIITQQEFEAKKKQLLGI